MSQRVSGYIRKDRDAYQTIASQSSRRDRRLGACRLRSHDAVVSHPPYGTGGKVAQQFIERALELNRGKAP